MPYIPRFGTGSCLVAELCPKGVFSGFLCEACFNPPCIQDADLHYLCRTLLFFAPYADFSDKNKYRLKAYYFSLQRTTQTTTLYNDHSLQQLWDKNTFVQSQYKKEFSRQWVFQSSAKWNWSYQRYLDPDTPNSKGKTENSYYQQNYSPLLLLSSTRMLDNLSFSLSTDGNINTMILILMSLHNLHVIHG